MNSLISKPTSSIVKAMYTTHLLEQGKTDSAISSAVYGFKWAYIMNDLAVPTDSSIVNLLMETSKIIASKPTKRRTLLQRRCYKNFALCIKTVMILLN